MSEIVEMNLSHVEAIHRIELESFPTPWSVGMLLVELVKPESDWYVWTDESDVIGYVGLQQVVDIAHVLNLAVRGDRRRQGIGTQLLERAMSAARIRRLHVVTLEVRESNVEARALYERFGFRVVGSRRGYYTDTREDAILMTLLMDDLAGSQAEGL
jgi:[ribosomal protein S18]-alanine N-acetyltransferase